MAELVKTGTEKGIYKYVQVSPDLTTQSFSVFLALFDAFSTIYYESYYWKLIVRNTETNEYETFKALAS